MDAVTRLLMRAAHYDAEVRISFRDGPVRVSYLDARERLDATEPELQAAAEVALTNALRTGL